MFFWGKNTKQKFIIIVILLEKERTTEDFAGTVNIVTHNPIILHTTLSLFFFSLPQIFFCQYTFMLVTLVYMQF